MNKFVSKTITASALAAAMAFAGGAAQAATVGYPVTIDEGGIPGTLTPSVVGVDQLSGQYDEVFTATSGTTFLTEAIFKAGSWYQDGSVAPTQLNMPVGFGFGYGLYAKFSSSGTFAPTATGFSFSGGTAYIELWADPSQNTNYQIKSSATGNVNNLTLASGAASVTDDLLLGSATVLLAGEGAGTTGIANGNFELIFSDWLLTAAGKGYFVAPNPFYLVLDLNGNFQNFVPVSGNSVQLTNNSANAFFIPEPGVLALTGIALLGLTLGRRRNGKSKQAA